MIETDQEGIGYY